jgi:hypothetical protein
LGVSLIIVVGTSSFTSSGVLFTVIGVVTSSEVLSIVSFSVEMGGSITGASSIIVVGDFLSSFPIGVFVSVIIFSSSLILGFVEAKVLLFSFLLIVNGVSTSFSFISLREYCIVVGIVKVFVLLMVNINSMFIIPEEGTAII